MKKTMRVEPVLETPRPSESEAVEIVVTSASPTGPSVNTASTENHNNNTKDNRFFHW